jgi:YidC/Oxa1 family membrane protein insertase
MDNQRLVIWAVFGVLAWMTYQAWQQDYAPAPPPVASNPAATSEDLEADPGLPELGPDLAVQTGAANTPQSMPAIDDADAPANNSLASAESIIVRTDVLAITISTQGGTLIGADLLHYPVANSDGI